MNRDYQQSLERDNELLGKTLPSLGYPDFRQLINKPVGIIVPEQSDVNIYSNTEEVSNVLRTTTKWFTEETFSLYTTLKSFSIRFPHDKYNNPLFFIYLCFHLAEYRDRDIELTFHLSKQTQKRYPADSLNLKIDAYFSSLVLVVEPFADPGYDKLYIRASFKHSDIDAYFETDAIFNIL